MDYNTIFSLDGWMFPVNATSAGMSCMRLVTHSQNFNLIVLYITKF